MSQAPQSSVDRRRVLQGALGAGIVAALDASVPARAIAASEEFDVVVVGAGAAGMTAALVAAKRGLRVVVVEKAATFGGSAARSGAGIWIRNNEVILGAGVPDSPALAARYLARVVGPDVPAEKQAAFLAHGPAMISFVLRHTPLRFRFMEGYPDYYPEYPGGLPNGASIEPDQFDGHLLGDELARLNPPYTATPPGVVIFSGDYKWLSLAAVDARGTARALECVKRYAEATLRGEKPLTMGQALAGGLRAGLLEAKVPVWLETPLVDLTFDASGRASGVVVERAGVTTALRASRGVVLCTGGFEHNASLRAQYQEQPIGTDWTVGARENTGDGIVAGKRAGAALDFMDDAWWGPTIPLPGEPWFCLAERSLPGSLLVNGDGVRFVNESAPYVDVVHAMYERNESAPTIPAWLITDQNYRNRYLFKDLPPLLPLPQAWYDAGAVHRDWSLAGLAKQIGVPPEALRKTVERFNGFAKAGVDGDFQRGASAYDRYYADPNVKPNPSLGALWLPPFYAFKIVPGDLGTKGGLRTDGRARVLRPDGSAIAGLYAAGNTSAAVMGHSYAGAGATIGPAMTFGYIAANDV